MTAMLPPPFADLERYAPTWCLASEPERWARRHESTMADIEDFYSGFFPRLEEAIAYCDKYPVGDVPGDVEHLLQMIYSLIMVAMPVEVFRQVRTVDAADAVLTRIKEPRP